MNRNNVVKFLGCTSSLALVLAFSLPLKLNFCRHNLKAMLV